MTNNPETAVLESADFIRYTKHTNAAKQLPHWLTEIMARSASEDPLKTVYVEGLEIDCWCADAGHINWLLKYLHPGVETVSKQKTIDHYKVGSFFSDELIVNIAGFVESQAMDYVQVESNKGLSTRFTFSSHLIVDYDQKQGMVCVTDLECRTMTLVTSAHTTHPFHHLGRCVRDLITGFLRDNGWLTFHAGAVKTDDGIFMIVGDQAAGKTSLILAMLHSGANYIANDRVFVKTVNGEPHLLSFPMPVAIGLGTTLQYPVLTRYIDNPRLRSYQCTRSNHEHIHATPKNKWHELPDKIQLFPVELERDFNCGKSSVGGKISAVLFPRLSMETHLAIYEQRKEVAKEIIENNRFPWQTDGVVPPWRPFDYGNPPEKTVQPAIDDLLALPLIDFHYFASKNRMNEISEYSQILGEYLKYRSS